ncbi:MAG: DUF3857 domain-containing protein [Lewinella sp.]|nr:DUF3857 domain-containing protein [Lewinella sp.]
MKTTLFSLLFATLSLPLMAQVEAGSFLNGANEIIEDEFTLRIEDAAELEYEHHRRVTILNERSRARHVVVSYSPDAKLLDLDVRLLTLAGQEIRKVRNNEIEDYSAISSFSIYEDDRVKHVELNHSIYPYVVDYTYRQKITGIGRAGLPDWNIYPNATSAIRRSIYTLTTTDELPIHYRPFNLDITPEINHSDGETTYRWVVENLPPVRPEPAMPFTFEALPWMAVSPGAFQVEDYQGSLASWQAFGAFLYQLWQGRDELPEATAAHARQLTAGLPDEAAKVAALYRYLQEQTRYVSVQLGIGGWQPFEASFVDEHQYGDCKALSNYMHALLKAVDIESYPVIIYANEDGSLALPEDFALVAFNHAILYVPSTDTWLECTADVLPSGYLTQSTQNRDVLLVTPEGGRLAHTPRFTAEENREELRATLALAADGAAMLEVEGQYTGQLYEDWAVVDHYGQEEDVKDQIRQATALAHLNFGEITLSPTPDRPAITVAYEAELPRYAARAGRRLFVPLNQLSPREPVPEALTERQYPVVQPNARSHIATIQLALPEGYRVESLPPEQKLESAFGQYHLRVEANGATVTLTRTLRLEATQRPAAEYDDYRNFFLEISRLDDAKMVLVAAD